MEEQYVDKYNLSLDDIIKYRLVDQLDQVPKYRRSRSRSCSHARSIPQVPKYRRSRTRSCSHARSIPQRPDSQNSETNRIKSNTEWRSQGGWKNRDRSASRGFGRSRRCVRGRSRSRRQKSQWQSNNVTGGIRSNYQWSSQVGWKDRERSVPRQFGRSRSLSRNRRSQCESNNATSGIISNKQGKGRMNSVSRSKSLERSRSQCSVRTGSLYAVRSGKSTRSNPYRSSRNSPRLYSSPETHCQFGFHPYQNLSTANSPNYIHVTNGPQNYICTASVNTHYADGDCPYYKKIKAAQQLRIAQQRVRYAKRVLNSKRMMYNRLQMVRPRPMGISKRMSRNTESSPILKRMRRHTYSFYPQERQKFDSSDYSDGELSVTINNELASKVADSPINLIKEAPYPAEEPEQPEGAQGFMPAEENSPGLKYKSFE